MKTSLLFLFAAAASASGVVPSALADKYPAKPIRLISPFVPGGGSPEELHKLIRRDVEKWRKTIADARIDRAG